MTDHHSQNREETASNENLPLFARAIRVDVLRMVHRARSSHIGSCFSIAEILAVLYGRSLKIDPQRPYMADRDRFILSKGHAAAALYATLAIKGFFPRSWLKEFYQDGSHLPGHATHTVPGVEVSTGSLGHGLSIAAGMAFVGRQASTPFRVFTLLSDGECDEGSVWEAILFAAHQHLDNLVAIVDANRIQSLGRVEHVLDLAPFADKWRACKWSVQEVDGHNIPEIEAALARVPLEQSMPSCIIAHTTKGRGVSFMEDDLLWHYRSPSKSEFAEALSELTLSE